MAHIETIGWGKCRECGGSVAVKLNRSGLAYFRCDHCGVAVQHHWKRTSDRFAAQFAVNHENSAPSAPSAPPPAAVETPRKSSTLLG